MQSLTSSVYTKKYTKRTQTIEMIGSLQKHKQIAHQQMLLRWLNFGSLQKHTQIAGKQNEIQMFEPIIDYAEYVDNTSVASLFDKTSAKFFFHSAHTRFFIQRSNGKKSYLLYLRKLFK